MSPESSRACLGAGSAGVTQSLVAGRWGDLGEPELHLPVVSLLCSLGGTAGALVSAGLSALRVPRLSRIVSLAGASD